MMKLQGSLDDEYRCIVDQLQPIRTHLADRLGSLPDGPCKTAAMNLYNAVSAIADTVHFLAVGQKRMSAQVGGILLLFAALK